MAFDLKLMEGIICELLETVKDKPELKDCTLFCNYHIGVALNECLEECCSSQIPLSTEALLKIESITDAIEDDINIGHWSDISVGIRRAYTLASFVKALLHLNHHKTCLNVDIIRKALEYIDKGLLMGAPFVINSELLTKAATIISEHIRTYFNENILPTSEEVEKDSSREYEFLFQSIEAHTIENLFLPSLLQFDNLFFKPQHPVKLQGCIDHWPARKKWKDLQYLLQIYGDRTVPVEIGKQYVDENWSQKLMTMREFIQKYYCHNEPDNIGYLAQHNLFEQIPELRQDICIPDYCCLSNDYDKTCDPDINCWFGPAGTVSSLHYDPKNNLLVQVYGTKQLLLFPPQDTQYLYPFEETMLSNTSRVDPLIPNLELYPNYVKSSMYKCLLKEGEMLFIPEKWWHHVVALDKSFSVSFWWQ